MKKILVLVMVALISQLTACSTTKQDKTASTQQLRADVEKIKLQIARLNKMEPGLKRMVAMESDLQGLITQLSVIAQNPSDSLPEAETGSNVQTATLEKVNFTEDRQANVSAEKQDSKTGNDLVAPLVVAADTQSSAALEPEKEVDTHTKPTLGKTKYNLQLASIRDESSLDKTWNSIRSKHEDLMADWSPVFESAVVANQTYYRVKAGEFDNYQTARSSCDSVRLSGTNCIVSKMEMLP